jgi:hypothetical protein
MKYTVIKNWNTLCTVLWEWEKMEKTDDTSIDTTTSGAGN